MTIFRCQYESGISILSYKKKINRYTLTIISSYWTYIFIFTSFSHVLTIYTFLLSFYGLVVIWKTIYLQLDLHTTTGTYYHRLIYVIIYSNDPIGWEHTILSLSSITLPLSIVHLCSIYFVSRYLSLTCIHSHTNTYKHTYIHIYDKYLH